MLRPIISLLLALFTTLTVAQAKRIQLVPYATIKSPLINESSGLIKSANAENTFWTHNDSGDQARLFAIDSQGYSLFPHRLSSDNPSIRVVGARNVDWEDIAVDSQGLLYIADSGNNKNTRQDLTLYILAEPNPLKENETKILETIRFRYPDQKSFPPLLKNFDCEALFIKEQTPYLLTKHRSDTFTKLYRLNRNSPDSIIPLTSIGKYDIGGKVTAADIDQSGTLLAVLTYKAVWIFQKPAHSDNYLEKPIQKLSIKAGQCEGICWENTETLIISNEEGQLFRLNRSEIPQL